MTDTWSEIFITYDSIEAQIIKDLLESGDMDVVLRSSRATPYPVNIGKMGEVMVMVRKEDKKRAEEAIRKFREKGRKMRQDNGLRSASEINALKKKVFYDMMELAGRLYIHVRYSEDVVIGDRGFLTEERKRGIVLVLNNRMNFGWDDAGISVNLVFGSTRQKCFIPADDIVSIVSPELKAQFTVSPDEADDSGDRPGRQRKARAKKSEKVIRVDFRNKK